ncbi:MAG: hypothetical protein HPY85_09840 [Anaerolineae bacterium]|nr:hypothetical protein [Anaerolineae bacterium]
MSEIYTPENLPPSSYSAPGVTAQGDPSKDWMAYVALGLGILNLCGICTFFIPFVCCITTLLSIGAVVFGILGMKSTKRTLAIIGLALGGVGLLLQIIASLIALIGGTFTSSFDPEMWMEQLENFDY